LLWHASQLRQIVHFVNVFSTAGAGEPAPYEGSPARETTEGMSSRKEKQGFGTYKGKVRIFVTPVAIDAAGNPLTP